MKKLLSYFNIAAFAAITILSSCGKDEEVTPTTPGVTFSPIDTYTAQLMGAQQAAAGSYFSSDDGKVYSATEAATKKGTVDITFAQVGPTIATVAPMLISPDNRQAFEMDNFGGETTFFAESDIDFTTVTEGRIDSISASTAKSIVVEEGGTYEFVNQEGIKGLIYVTDYTPGTGTKLDGTLTIEVKVQRE